MGHQPVSYVAFTGFACKSMTHPSHPNPNGHVLYLISFLFMMLLYVSYAYTSRNLSIWYPFQARTGHSDPNAQLFQ